MSLVFGTALLVAAGALLALGHYLFDRSAARGLPASDGWTTVFAFFATALVVGGTGLLLKAGLAAAGPAALAAIAGAAAATVLGGILVWKLAGRLAAAAAPQTPALTADPAPQPDPGRPRPTRPTAEGGAASRPPRARAA